jgi:hypothetical protein
MQIVFEYEIQGHEFLEQLIKRDGRFQTVVRESFQNEGRAVAKFTFEKYLSGFFNKSSRRVSNLRRRSKTPSSREIRRVLRNFVDVKILTTPFTSPWHSLIIFLYLPTLSTSFRTLSY